MIDVSSEIQFIMIQLSVIGSRHESNIATLSTFLNWKES